MDGIRTIFPDLHQKTPFDYSQKVKDFEFTEMIMEHCLDHQVNIIFNIDHCLMLIESDFSLARDMLAGIFTQSEIAVESPFKLGNISKSYLLGVQRPI